MIELFILKKMFYLIYNSIRNLIELYKKNLNGLMSFVNVHAIPGNEWSEIQDKTNTFFRMKFASDAALQ